MNLDLFGEGVFKPTVQVKSLLNVAHGFTEFWKAWPSGPRKVAKQQCLNKWAKFNCSSNATEICRHVEAMKATKAWQDGFIPMPLTYLNQQRWEGQAEAEIDPESRPAIEALALKHGMPKWDEMREQWNIYKARVKKACMPH